MEVQELINYETYVKPYEHRFCKIVIPDQFVLRLKAFAYDLIQAKQTEQHHQVDNNQEFKRFYTGLLGEAVLEMLLQIPIIDWKIGDSKQYNTPDIKSLGIGIKTVEYGKFPIIFKHNTYPQIINLKTSDNTILVAGLAGVHVLNTYQSDDLILSPALKARGTKSGFYGLHTLIDLQKINITRMVQ